MQHAFCLFFILAGQQHLVLKGRRTNNPVDIILYLRRNGCQLGLVNCIIGGFETTNMRQAETATHSWGCLALWQVLLGPGT